MEVWTPLAAVYQKANPAYPGFYNEGVHVVGPYVPNGVQGQSPVGVLGDEVPQKLKNNDCILNFSQKLASLGNYILLHEE